MIGKMRESEGEKERRRMLAYVCFLAFSVVAAAEAYLNTLVLLFVWGIKGKQVRVVSGLHALEFLTGSFFQAVLSALFRLLNDFRLLFYISRRLEERHETSKGKKC